MMSRADSRGHLPVWPDMPSTLKQSDQSLGKPARGDPS